MTPAAFFYPATISPTELVGLVAGRQPSDDRIDFPAEAPRTVERELAVPFLPGMDDIEVTAARVVLRAAESLVDAADFQVHANGTQGVFVTLPAPQRLKKLELAYQQPASPPGARVVVRAATKEREEGAPLFAAPPFPSPGPMFDPVLGGMSVSTTGNRRVLTLPGVLGDAWLVQLAAGDSATALNPAAFAVVPQVQRVTLDGAPSNVSVALVGEATVPLWNNPAALLPEVGEQEVSFTPLAQKQLSQALAAGPTTPTLPVRLRFDAGSPGAVAITARSLEAEYLVRPVEPTTLRLAGSDVPLVLNAPAGLAPGKSEVRLAVKHLGRELNAASPRLSTAPVSGLRLDVTRQVATAVKLASAVRLASVRVHLAATSAAEVVMEIRADRAGAPGRPAASPMVAALAPGAPGWVELELPEPLAVAAEAPLWISLRVNKGEVRWFAASASEGVSRVSLDRGQTWGPPDPRLGPPGPLLVQLFDQVDAPATPRIEVRHGPSVVWTEIPLVASGREWTARTTLPPALHALLGTRPGEGKVPTELRLFCPAVLDLRIESLVLRYDPFTARGG